MIMKYGYSITGKSHIMRGTGCQDAHKIKEMKNGWFIAAIADGVGSAKNSHIRAKIASDTVVDFCEECMPYDYNVISIKSMIRTAFNYALKKIHQEADSSGEPLESYDTTLTMVIYDGKRIIYGHSGDGAILGLTNYGNYVEITTPQKGKDLISVLPLRAGYTQWVIDTYNEDLAAVVLVTDGMLDTISPYLLKFNNQNIYIPLAMFFGDPYCFGSKTDLRDIKEFITADDDYHIEKFYDRIKKALIKHFSNTAKAKTVCGNIKQNGYPIMLMNNQQDDKTVVGLINTDAVTENQNDEYYDEPDWMHLQELWNRKAYPHLYQEEYREEIVDTYLVNEIISGEQPESMQQDITLVPSDEKKDKQQKHEASKQGGLLNKVKRLL